MTCIEALLEAIHNKQTADDAVYIFGVQPIGPGAGDLHSGTQPLE